MISWSVACRFSPEKPSLNASFPRGWFTVLQQPPRRKSSARLENWLPQTINNPPPYPSCTRIHPFSWTINYDWYSQVQLRTSSASEQLTVASESLLEARVLPIGRQDRRSETRFGSFTVPARNDATW